MMKKRRNVPTAEIKEKSVNTAQRLKNKRKKATGKRRKQVKPKKNKLKAATLKEKLKTFFSIDNLKGNAALLVLFIAVVFFFWNFSTHRVDGHSMEPTFQTKDRILIAKNSEPTRYSIITFEPKNREKESYLKRIIGMPGDRIQLLGNALFLLPKENETKGDLDLANDQIDGTIKSLIADSVINELVSYKRIPKDYYFVEGDNRLHSDDSRVYGLINKKQIEGVVLYRYYPFNKMGMVH
ncbi:signal peptidase I [Enterococcus termitis]|nr:signal peptidase I [Enterococcus termitis]